MQATKNTTIEIYGQTYEIAVGSIVYLDGKNIGEKLLPGDDACGSWQGCDFRYPNPVQGWEVKHAIACNVSITGRTMQIVNGSRCVRVKIEWVGDCEPSTFSSGWLLLA